jgi:hypothetical protein
MKYQGVLFFVGPFLVVAVILFAVVGTKGRQKPIVPESADESPVSAEKSWSDQTTTPSREAKVLNFIDTAERIGTIYSISTATRTVRVHDATWNEFQVGDKQTSVEVLAEYMGMKTGTDVVYVLSDRNDLELARKGPWGGISITR